jgi:hypothetical protein
LLLQLSHTNAIFSPQELADVSEAEMAYAQSLYQEDYENGQLTNTSLVNNTIAAGLANLTYEELLFAEAAAAACGNTTDIGNITEILPPEKMEGNSDQIFASVSFGQPVNAFFCDTSSNQVPDPVLSQGDTIRVCVRLSQTSSYFHLEDIYMMAFTQPTTGVDTYYAVYDGDASAVATKNCELGLCNILSQVPSRFFDQDSGPVRIVGVALLNFGPQDRRVLAPFDFSGRRQLQSGDAPRSAFELEAGIIGRLEQQGRAPTYTNSGIGNACVLLLATTVTFFAVIVFLVLWWRRKQRKQPTPSMKVQEPLRIVCQNYPSSSSTSFTVENSVLTGEGSTYLYCD